jgi:hypothetical protein
MCFVFVCFRTEDTLTNALQQAREILTEKEKMDWEFLGWTGNRKLQMQIATSICYTSHVESRINVTIAVQSVSCQLWLWVEVSLFSSFHFPTSNAYFGALLLLCYLISLFTGYHASLQLLPNSRQCQGLWLWLCHFYLSRPLIDSWFLSCCVPKYTSLSFSSC